MELWDLYDENRNHIGKTIERSQAIPAGCYTLMVYGCLFNPEGKMLIQQRSFNKKVKPGMWDLSVGGHSLAGETSRESIHRELLEELGIDFDFSNTRPHLTEIHPLDFCDYYLIEVDADTNELVLQSEEVHAVRWVTMEELFSMMDSGEFIPYFKGMVQYFFEGRKQLGFQINI